MFSKLIPFTALLLVLVLFATTFSAATLIAGDMDGSGRANASDAIYLLYNTIYGDDDYPLKRNGDINEDGTVDSDDAVYLLYNSIFGPEDYPIPEFDGSIPITLNNNGAVNTYDLMPGDELPTLNTYISKELDRYQFIGWYDKTLTTRFTTVPDYVTTLYAVYDGYTAYEFNNGGFYDPNNRRLMTAVNDPFGGDGKVLSTKVFGANDSLYYGFYRGLVPSVYDNSLAKGFDFKKGHTYKVSFGYRFADTDPDAASCYVSVYAVDPQGVHLNGYKTVLDPQFTATTGTLTKQSDWTKCEFTVTNTTDYKHLYIRLLGSSSTTAYNLYLDDLVILDITEDDSSVKLVNGGKVESTALTAGNALPVLDDVYDKVTDRTHKFAGWYDKTLTTKYTTVNALVNTYYAKFETYTSYSFESGGMYDPNNKYNVNSKGIPCWYRVPDPTGADNICIRANLNSNGNNTHFAISLFEGSDEGFKLEYGKKYVIKFDYYLQTKSLEEHSISVRGSSQAKIGTSGEKTDSLTSGALITANGWDNARMMFTPDSTVESSPYLIIMSQGSYDIDDLMIYLDNIVITEYAADDSFIITTPADNVSYNDNGVVTTIAETYVGAELMTPEGYYGANFVGWYNELLNAPYAVVPKRRTTLYAKYDGAVINFENGGYYDPNNKRGTTGMAMYSLAEDPTDSSNTVLKYGIENNGNNIHFALNESGYSSEGFKLTRGNKYTIYFKYYAENLNGKSIGIQFRGCNPGNIGIAGGKSNGYGGYTANVEKSWTGVSVSFTYNGTGLTEGSDEYLTMLAQQSTDSALCTATLYIDDVVIKETPAAKTYTQKGVKVNGWTIGYQPRPHYIVVPSQNFSYLAMMQCEELVTLLKNSTASATTFKIVRENEWTQADNQFNIFVGDVTGHSRDSTAHKIDTSNFTYDDYAISFGGGNVYIDGGSPYALAMGISEFGKAFEAAPDGSTLSGTVTGKYSEKIGSYSTKSYYRPTFLEDFDGTEVNTDVWRVVDGSSIKARGFYDENGVYYSQADNTWRSVRSAEHTYIEDGKLVIAGAYSKETQTFYGGMLRSHGKMEYRYGYLEVSCITPHGEGIWTSLWATPHSGATGLYRNEVDVNECFGDAQYTAFNMHTWPTSAGGNIGKTHYSLDGRYSTAKKYDSGKTAGLNDGFHTFGYLWTEDKGVFTVDGKVHFEYTFDKNSSYYINDVDAFNEKMSLIFSMTVANPSAGADPRLGASYWNTSNKYIAEYIHIYQIDGQEIYFTPPEATE